MCTSVGMAVERGFKPVELEAEGDGQAGKRETHGGPFGVLKLLEEYLRRA